MPATGSHTFAILALELGLINATSPLAPLYYNSTTLIALFSATLGNSSYQHIGLVGGASVSRLVDSGLNDQ